MANVTTHPWKSLHFSLPWQYIVFTCHGKFSTAMSNLLGKFWKILKHDKLLQIPRGKGLRRLGHRGTDARGCDSHATDGRAWRSPPLSPGWLSPGAGTSRRQGASRCGGCPWARPWARRCPPRVFYVELHHCMYGPAHTVCLPSVLWLF